MKVYIVRNGDDVLGASNRGPNLIAFLVRDNAAKALAELAAGEVVEVDMDLESLVTPEQVASEIKDLQDQTPEAAE